jgi:hypothetical protein
MLGNGRLRNAGAVRQGVDGLFPVAGQALENRSTGRVGESFENVIRNRWHSQTITLQLWIRQVFFLVGTAKFLKSHHQESQAPVLSASWARIRCRKVSALGRPA